MACEIVQSEDCGNKVADPCCNGGAGYTHIADCNKVIVQKNIGKTADQGHQKPCTRFSVGDKKALELHLQKAEGQKQNNRQRIFAAIVKNGVIGAQKMNNITKKQAGDDGKCDAQTNRKQNNECNDLVCLFCLPSPSFLDTMAVVPVPNIVPRPMTMLISG